jgi:hypothetical protein
MEVGVNGVSTCAKAGFIDYCDVYARIVNGVLSDCKKCKSGYHLVEGLYYQFICVSKLITNCLLYATTGDCGVML